MKLEFLSEILIYVGLLTLVVNVITEVLKKTFGWKNNVPTQILCLVISIALSIVVVIIYCQLNNIAYVWYFGLGSVVLGFFVAYAAMFGFDKLKEVVDSYTTNSKGSDNNGS